MDKSLIRQRFARAIPTYDCQATVQRTMAQRMVTLLDRHLPPDAHQRVWEVGCGTGLFTHAYLQHHRPQEYLLNDLCPEMQTPLEDILDTHTRFVPGDVEKASPQGCFSLIVSCASLQWLENPLCFLQRCRTMLTARGHVAFSLFGEENLKEIRALSGAALDYPSLHDWCSKLSALGYQPLHADEERVTLCFDSPGDVLRHLRQTGVTGIRKEAWTRKQLEDFTTEYRRRFSTTDGKVSLTYHPIYILLTNPV